MANNKQQSSQIFRKYIIIVIDSVDKLKESSGREELPEWLPNDLPDNIRIIISCNKNSRCYNYLFNRVKSQIHLKNFDCEKKIEFFELFIKGRRNLGLDLVSLKKFVEKSSACNNLLFLNLVMHFCLLTHSEYPSLPLEVVEGCENSDMLFESILDYYIGQSINKNIIMKVLGYLAITRCGLSIEDLSQICCHSDSVIAVLEVFSICLFSCESLFLFKSDLFSKVILSKSIINPANQRFDILDYLSKQKITVRTVHERLYHYRELKEWLAFKDTLCTLEVFFIMYTPQHKLEHIRSWSLLSSHHFDPVHEYNKTLEHFVEQHKPKNREIFIILVQLCRFFKEFSKLDPPGSCEFRHPPLKRINEIKELTLYEEIIQLSEMINQVQINPLKKDERITVENKKAWNSWKESILKAEDEMVNRTFSMAIQKNFIKKHEMLLYKRWIWIQFPWCSLDVYSDFSQIMGVFNASEINHQHDNEMAVTSLRIIRDAKLKAKKKFVQPKRDKTPLVSAGEYNDRSVSAFVKATGIMHNTLPPLNNTIQLNPINESMIGKQLVRGNTTENLIKRPKSDYNFDLMFKELTPSNVLVKVGAKVSDYSNYEILKKKKENNELQTNYNKLVNEARMKSLQLQGIKSQIAKSEDKMKESREISAQIETMKRKMEKIYEKINKAEVESKRLETVISSCFKNSAKNELWEKGLEKGIHNIIGLIESEKTELKAYEEERETLELQINEFEHWFQDKIKIQENTLDRVIEQFSFKASIKETLTHGENKRANLINVQLPPRSESYFINRLKERQIMLKKIQKLKEVLEEKIDNFEKIIQRLQTVASISGPQDLTSIILQLERKHDLFQSKYKLDDKLKDLKSQKDALEVKLAFLKQKEQKAYNVESNPESLNMEIIEYEKKNFNLSEAVKRQELTYYACEGIVEHILNVLGHGDKKLTKSNHFEVFRLIGDKILAMIRLQTRPILSHSHTLKVTTLQVPYSSKFNIEENTPYGPSALINSPIANRSDRRVSDNPTKLRRPLIGPPKNMFKE